MKTKNLLILVMAALVLAALAYMQSIRERRTATGPVQLGEYVLPSLQDTDTLNSVRRVTFMSASSTVTVAKAEDSWVSPAKYDYPVKFDSVRDFLHGLLDLKVGQVVPSGPSLLPELDLVSPDSDAARGKGTLLKLQDGSGNLVASLLLGKEHTKKAASPGPFGGFGGYPDGRYVSTSEGVFLVTETFSSIPSSDIAWLDRDIVNVSPFDVTRISVTDSEGNTLALRRPDDDGDLTLDNLTEDEKLDTAKVSALAGVLSYLNFTDIADPALADETTGLDKPVIYSARTKDDKVYELVLGGTSGFSDDRYARLSAKHDPAQKEKEQVDAEGEQDATPGVDRKKVAAEIDEFNRKTRGWTYLLRPYKVESVTTDRATLIEKQEEPGDQTEDETGE